VCHEVVGGLCCINDGNRCKALLDCQILKCRIRSFQDTHPPARSSRRTRTQPETVSDLQRSQPGQQRHALLRDSRTLKFVVSLTYGQHGWQSLRALTTLDTSLHRLVVLLHSPRLRACLRKPSVCGFATDQQHRTQMRYLVIGTSGGQIHLAKTGAQDPGLIYRTGFALLGARLASSATRAVQAFSC
jgi:hypothetical protein